MTSAKNNRREVQPFLKKENKKHWKSKIAESKVLTGKEKPKTVPCRVGLSHFGSGHSPVTRYEMMTVSVDTDGQSETAPGKSMPFGLFQSAKTSILL